MVKRSVKRQLLLTQNKVLISFSSGCKICQKAFPNFLLIRENLATHLTKLANQTGGRPQIHLRELAGKHALQTISGLTPVYKELTQTKTKAEQGCQLTIKFSYC